MAGVDFLQKGAKGDTGATGATGATGPAGPGPTVARNSAQFDKTNQTLANVPGLSVTVTTGATYAFSAAFSVVADLVGQAVVAIGGTATATEINYSVASLDFGNQIVNGGYETTMGTSEALGSAGDHYAVKIDGTIVVNAGGTLTVQFAQGPAAAGTSSVVRGGYMILTPIA